MQKSRCLANRICLWNEWPGSCPHSQLVCLAGELVETGTRSDRRNEKRENSDPLFVIKINAGLAEMLLAAHRNANQSSRVKDFQRGVAHEKNLGDV